MTCRPISDVDFPRELLRIRRFSGFAMLEDASSSSSSGHEQRQLGGRKQSASPGEADAVVGSGEVEEGRASRRRRERG